MYFLYSNNNVQNCVQTNCEEKLKYLTEEILKMKQFLEIEFNFNDKLIITAPDKKWLVDKK